MSNGDDRFEVTIIPPAAGPAPVPSPELREVFATLKDIQASSGMEDDLRTGVDVARALLPVVPFSLRARGLSTGALTWWAQELRATLTGPQRAQLFEYLERCRAWERALREAVEMGEADWEGEGSRHVHPGAAENALADSLGAFGIPVLPRVRVAEDAARRRWGHPSGAIYLRWAHRERAYLLRLASELDGLYLHDHEEGQEYDQGRDQILAGRGWYVARLSESCLRRDCHGLVGARLSALVEQHRRAMLLARSDLPTLKRNLA